jgi:hypothetical protein
MQTANAKLEERITALERRLRKVQAQLKEVHQAPQRPWWEQLAGRFKNDPLFDEVVKASRSQEMGIVDTVRFLNQFTTGYGDYTEEREALFKDLTLDEILAATKKTPSQQNA